MADTEISGIPIQSHAGGHNYGFMVDTNPGQWYVIPLDAATTSPAAAGVQALKVELAKTHEIPISFEADDTRVIPFHGGAQGFFAHDID